MAISGETGIRAGFDGDDMSGTAKPRKSRAKAASTADDTVEVAMADADVTPKVTSKKAGAPKAAATKSDAVLKLLRSTKGATVDVMMKATGWQAHSVRGFLSAVVKKKLMLNLNSEVGKDGQRRYRISDVGQAS